MGKYELIKENLDNIKKLLEDNTPVSEVARIIGVKYETLVNNLKKLNVPFKTNQHRVGKKHLEKRKPAEYYLREGVRVSIPVLRRKLIEDGLKENKCENPECGITDWHGKFLPLELHHINGNHYDNRLENLILLCPNCHAQIHGYNKPKENKITKVVKIQPKHIVVKQEVQCQECGNLFVPKRKIQKFCSQICTHKSQERREVTKENLIEALRTCGSFTGVGNMYNVSDKAVVKWCKRYGIPTHKKDLLEYINNI